MFQVSSNSSFREFPFEVKSGGRVNVEGAAVVAPPGVVLGTADDEADDENKSATTKGCRNGAMLRDDSAQILGCRDRNVVKVRAQRAENKKEARKGRRRRKKRKEKGNVIACLTEDSTRPTQTCRSQRTNFSFHLLRSH